VVALNCVEPTDVHLVAGPLYHSAPGGFALYAHLFGQTVVVMRKFDPEDALRSSRATAAAPPSWRRRS
jgi:acyl-CoA synthetase (AMP-forming)/AMP-acid ligase II